MPCCKKEHDERPWGSYTVLDESKYWKIKEIRVNPQSILSLQSHENRDETWVCVLGSGVAHDNGNLFPIAKGRPVYIEAGCKHRIENPTDNELVLIEVQTGQSFEEDDIVRYEDNYGRV